MRTSGDPDRFEYHFEVPLTGREPILGQLKARLRSRASGWGWVTLTGPSGGGISRLLDEVATAASESGEPPLLRLQPAPGVRAPMATLRRALRGLFPQAPGVALERAISRVHPHSRDEARVLAAWLGGREPPGREQPLHTTLVRTFLEHLVPTGPVLVDDLQHVDAATLEVLLPSAHGQGFGVLAGATGSLPEIPGSQAWPLEPLGETQVELLLRRWLRNAATARRLAPILTARCEGWPGRVVEAVRRLARMGCLADRGRGVAVAKTPARWPDGKRSAGAAIDWVRMHDASARLVLELAAVQGAPDDVDLLADAAGVTASMVRALLAEAAAARGGLAQGRMFATRAARHAFRDRLPEARRDNARACLEGAWARRATTMELSDDDVVRRLHLATQGGDRYEIQAALEHCLTRLPLTRKPDAWHLDALAAAAASLPPGEVVVAGVAHRLWHAGRRDQARRLLDGAALTTDPSAAHLLAQARLREADEAREILAQGLPDLAPSVDPVQFDAWATLARQSLDAGDTPAAREAWRAAGRVRPTDDLERSARWHEGLATCATSDGRARAATAHGRRAVRLRLSGGEVHTAGGLLLSLGERLVRQGRMSDALEPLRRAAHILHLLGDEVASAEASYLGGRVYTWLNDFDRAVERLLAALVAAEHGSANRLLQRIHLALAAACRGCGDLERERHHAEMAAGLATTALARVQAAAVLARADLRAGVPGAERLLVRCERDLRSAGFAEEADRARAALVDARLRAGDSERAQEILPIGPAQAVEELAAARLHLAAGRMEEACAGFELLGADGRLPPDLRATCYAHLADALRMRGRLPEARAAAVAASALLQVTRRSRADDARLHDVLARVFRDVGEHGRAVGHRSAARRGMRALARATDNPRERRRLIRSFWRRDPRPGRNVG